MHTKVASISTYCTYLVVSRYFCLNLSKPPLKELDDPSPLPPPVQEQGLIPELREHLDEGRLPHAGLPFNDDRDTTLVALMNVEHLDGVIECQDIGRVIDDGDTFVVVSLDI